MEEAMKQWEADSSVPGLGILSLPSGVRTWYLRFREQGGRQRTQKIGRADVLNRAAARREALKLLSEIAQGRAPQKAAPEPTVADLHGLMDARHYSKLRASTADAYRRMWKLHVLPEIGRKRIGEVQRRDILDLLDDIKPIMRNRVLQSVRAAFNKAELWQLRPEGSNPCSKIAKLTERTRKRHLSPAELQRLLTALDEMATTPLRWRFTQLIRLLLLTGCRVGEICRGRWEWINEPASLLVIPIERHKTGEKTGEERVVQLHPTAMQILRELRGKSNSAWIIAGSGDGHLVGYQKLWLELMDRAKITGLTVHDLRRSYASIGLSAGVSLSQIGQLLGHASPQTTARYAYLMDDAAKAAAALIGDAIAVK